MKCKNPECNNEVKENEHSRRYGKVFCSNSCCREFYAKQHKEKRKPQNKIKEYNPYGVEEK